MSYSAFWLFYLQQHSAAATRAWHFAGTGAALLFLLAAVTIGPRWLVLVALLAGYAPAWLSHRFIEHNRPATFTYPLWSLVSDLRMLALWLSGRLEGELRRAGVVEVVEAPRRQP